MEAFFPTGHLAFFRHTPVNIVYPQEKLCALPLKQWILNKEIKLSGEKDEALNRWQYTDNRTEKDKISKVWKVPDIDKAIGVIRSKTNTLLNKSGGFTHKSKPKENWWEILLNKITNPGLLSMPPRKPYPEYSGAR